MPSDISLPVTHVPDDSTSPPPSVGSPAIESSNSTLSPTESSGSTLSPTTEFSSSTPPPTTKRSSHLTEPPITERPITEPSSSPATSLTTAALSCPISSGMQISATQSATPNSSPPPYRTLRSMRGMSYEEVRQMAIDNGVHIIDNPVWYDDMADIEYELHGASDAFRAL
ncbi:hypothetical protein AJ80_06089 [Polytolypa hystricis UAMH7299]|uniref:Uncharacterized protein n=1 Tax=Polytolypa hystricis (strain UAMH7299) TaxID=1447883 RepID=A0A2B7XYR4_POLH7|nr:hypothetical protein AJ80_06089 [Polytolypa hystricis UAMH7299]